MAKLRSKITRFFGKTQPNFRKTQVKIANFCKTWIKIGQKHDPNFGFTKYGFAKTQVKVIKTQLCEFRQEVPNLDSCTNKKPDYVHRCRLFFCAFGPKLNAPKNSIFRQNSIFCRNSTEFCPRTQFFAIFS